MTVTTTPFLKTFCPQNGFVISQLAQNAPNLTYSDLGLKKFPRGRNPWTPLLRGPLCGRGGVGREVEALEGRGNGRGCGWARKVVCPGAHAGSWWAWLALL